MNRLTGRHLGDLEGSRVLITGGAGSIGGRLASHLASVADVTILDDLSSGRPVNVPETARLVRGSILEPTSVRAALSCGVDYVFHLAALFANQNSVEHPEQDLLVNGLGTLRVLQESIAAEAKAVVYASSSCVYGSKPGVLDEQTVLSASLDTPYAISKLLGEQYANYFANSSAATRVVSVRYFNVYGPGELPGAYRNVIPNFIQLALKGQPLTITGTGDEERDFTFVDDAARGTALAALHGPTGSCFNIGTGKTTNIRRLADLIIELTDSRSPIEFVERRGWDSIATRQASIDRARSTLGFEPQTELEKGLDETVSWLRANLP